MNNFKMFLYQHIFPGFYAHYVNKKYILRNYNTQHEFNVDTSSIIGNEQEYILSVEKDLENQLDRKKRIEDKAKSLLFIIAVAVTAVTFSLTYLKTLEFNFGQLISVLLIFISVIYLVFGAIRALQALNIRKFHINQTTVEKTNNTFILKPKQENEAYLQHIIKSKQLNDLINIQLSNYTFASFNLIRNGIIFFVLFFISTISFFYVSSQTKNSDSHLLNNDIMVKINDSIKVDIPYSLEVKYDVKNLKVDKEKIKVSKE